MYNQEAYNIAVNAINLIDTLTNEFYAKIDSYSDDELDIFSENIADFQDIKVEFYKIKTIYENQVEKSRQRRRDYMVIDGDTLPRIANRFFKDATLWETIFVANQLTDIELTTGDILIIPMVS